MGDKFSSTYDSDFLVWSEEQARALRERVVGALDAWLSAEGGRPARVLEGADLDLAVAGRDVILAAEVVDTGEAAIHRIHAQLDPVDLVVLDVMLPGMNGFEVVSRLRQEGRYVPVLMLTVYDDSEQVFKSLMAGATGYLLKRTPKEKLRPVGLSWP